MRAAAAALLAISLIAAAKPSPARRSAGYAGSLPDSQFAALATGDCTKLNAAPGLSHVLVPVFEDCDETIPSPDRRLEIRTKKGDFITVDVVDRRSGRAVALPLLKLNQPAMIMWRPSSDGFFVNDGEGSGQVSRFRYIGRVGGHWRESRRFDRRAVSLLLRRQKCRRGAYANVSGAGWTRTGQVRAVVQEGVHSAGCIEPRHANVALEVIGNPWTGRLHLRHVRLDR